MPAARTLTTRVRFEQQVAGIDAHGMPTGSWAEVCTVWGDARLLTGLQAAQAGTQGSSASGSVRIRWRTGLTPAMRAVIAGQAYDIQAVLPDLQRRQHVDILIKAPQ